MQDTIISSNLRFLMYGIVVMPGMSDRVALSVPYFIFVTSGEQ